MGREVYHTKVLNELLDGWEGAGVHCHRGLKRLDVRYEKAAKRAGTRHAKRQRKYGYVVYLV